MLNQTQKTIAIPAKDFRKGLKMAKHAVCKSETRINLKTAHIVVRKGLGLIEATDGHRAARYSFKCKGKGFDIMVPLDDWPLYLAKCPKTGDYTFPDPNTGMKFPNMDAIWPDHGRVVIVDGMELIDTIKAACSTYKEREKPIRLAMRGDSISISTEPTEIGNYNSVLHVERTDAGDYSMGFNAAYILHFLQAVPKGGKITMEMAGPLNPVVFRSDLAPEYAEVVMPLRIEWKGNYPEVSAPPVQVSPPVKPVQVEPTAPVVDVEPQDDKTSPPLTMADYSKKAVIITGETYPHRERIKNAVPKAHGIWHRKAEGWIFSKKYTLKLQEALKDLLAA